VIPIVEKKEKAKGLLVFYIRCIWDASGWL